MKRISIVFLFACATLFAATPLFAQSRPFGIGVIVGEPTGVSFKSWQDGTNAIQGALAWSFIDEGALQVQADYLWHEFSLLKPGRGKLPLYYGIGGRAKFGDQHTRVGVRGVLGLSYIFEGEQWDVFFEVVPIFDFIDETDFTVNGAVGLRYYF